jgi:hypothetical protein
MLASRAGPRSDGCNGVGRVGVVGWSAVWPRGGAESEQGRGPGRERRWQLSQTGLRFSDSADEYPPEWRRASGPLQRVVWVTADEAEAIGEALLEVFEPFSDRLIDADRRPPEATPVELIAFMHPLRKPESSC